MDNFPKLVNPLTNSTIIINNSSFSIGRSLSCDHIVEKLGVSRLHCCIKKTGDVWTLFDKSTNGTYVNEKLYKCDQTENSVILNHRDVITLGSKDTTFVFIDPKVDEKHAEREQNPSEETPVNAGPNPSKEAPVNAEPPVFPQDEVIYEEAASLLVASLEEVSQAVTDTEEAKQAEPVQTLSENQNFDIMSDEELVCSICSELFIKAVTLNCSHSFCKYCIEQWKKNKCTCPICRKNITTTSSTLVLDNLIDKLISKQNDDVKENRKALVQQREETVVKAASSSSAKESAGENSVIEINSEDDDDDEEYEDSDYNYFSDDHDYDAYDCYLDNHSGSGYYGGYGRCYICNEPGHWANSCPLKTRR